MKPILCALALFTALAPALAQDAATAPVATSQTTIKSVTLDSGLIVTPIATHYTDLERMMDVAKWQFLVEPPAPETRLNAQLELRVPGKPTQQHNGYNIELYGKTEVTFGILPKGGSTFTNAEWWRIYFHARSLEAAPHTPNADNDFGGDNVNLIKDMKFKTYSMIGNNAYEKPRPNGDIVLIQFFDNDANGIIVAELVLVLTAKPKTK